MRETRNIRLNIEIPEDTRHTMKELALKRHQTLKDYLMSIINDAIDLEKKLEEIALEQKNK